jgi:hypothetical protein
MSNRILTILILFFTQISNGQKLTVEAVYYDNLEAPFKLERKYTNNDNEIYITHGNKGSVCVNRQTTNIGDTTIIKEASYRIFTKNKIEAFQGCDNWLFSSNNAGDTVWVGGYNMDFSPDSMHLIVDTTLTGEAAKNSRDFLERINKIRVPLILSGKMTINTDSLILNETVISYLLNGIPVKVEVFDSSNNKYSTSKGELSKNKLIWTRNLTDKKGNPFQIDTISWNKDTTEIIWLTNRLDDVQWNTILKYSINGNQLKIVLSETSKMEIEYLDGKSIFGNMLIGAFMYSYVLYNMELPNMKLQYLDREKIVSVTTNGQTYNYDYTFDKQGRVVEQLTYVNGKLNERVKYKYEN